MTKRKKIIKLHRQPGLYIKETGDVKERGVFCTTAIKAGTTLEVTPSIILNEKATDQVDKTILANYTFAAGKISLKMRRAAQVKRPDESSAVVMGMASFCNHGAEPNAEILWEEQGGMLYYMLRATRDIPKGTEICTTYGKTWFEDRTWDNDFYLAP